MRINGLLSLILGLAVIVLNNGCREEAAPEKKPIPPRLPPVDFVVGQVLGEFLLINHTDYNFFDGDTLITGDTLLNVGNIRVKTVADYGNIEWKVGGFDETITENEFFLPYFEPVASLPITLTARLKSIDWEDSVVTITKHVTLVDFWDNPIFGNFRGTNISDPENPFDVQIIPMANFGNIGSVVNLNRGCNPTVPTVGIRGARVQFAYKTIYFMVDHYYQSCSYPIGMASLDQTGNKIQIKYSIGSGDGDHPDKGERVYELFVGTRQ